MPPSPSTTKRKPGGYVVKDAVCYASGMDPLRAAIIEELPLGASRMSRAIALDVAMVSVLALLCFSVGTGRGRSSLGRSRSWLGSQASKHPKHLRLAGKCCPLGAWHHIVGGALIVDSRDF